GGATSAWMRLTRGSVSNGQWRAPPLKTSILKNCWPLIQRTTQTISLDSGGSFAVRLVFGLERQALENRRLRCRRRFILRTDSHSSASKQFVHSKVSSFSRKMTQATWLSNCKAS